MDRCQEDRKVLMKGGEQTSREECGKGSRTHDMDVDRKILGDEGNMGGSGGRYQPKLSMYEIA